MSTVNKPGQAHAGESDRPSMRRPTHRRLHEGELHALRARCRVLEVQVQLLAAQLSWLVARSRGTHAPVELAAFRDMVAAELRAESDQAWGGS